MSKNLKTYFSSFANVYIHNEFEYENITSDSVLNMAEELKKHNLPINGFLSDSKITFNENNIEIKVNNGISILKDVKFTDKLAELILKRTKVRPCITLICENENLDKPTEKCVVVKKPKPTEKIIKNTETTDKTPTFTVPGLIMDDTPVKVFHGKSFKPSGFSSLSDIGNETGKCVVWGDVFFSEV
ncbi:MAG: hypothetical protein RR902_07315, partial [Oscillospiraceae bacterium]